MYILWDKLFQTDKKIKSNRPDILMIDQELKNCLLVDFAVFALNEIHLSKWLKSYQNIRTWRSKSQGFGAL